MRVRIKRVHPDAVVPRYAHDTDAGLDITAVSVEYDSNGNAVYHTGLAFEIPEGYVGLLFPRSSVSKKDMALTNSVGVIDSGYRGEVTFKFKYAYRCDNVVPREVYGVGERVGQMIIIPYPKVEFEEVDELNGTERGTGGYGSTGR